MCRVMSTAFFKKSKKFVSRGKVLDFKGGMGEKGVYMGEMILTHIFVYARIQLS